MTPIDLIIGIVAANVILYFGGEIRKVILHEIQHRMKLKDNNFLGSVTDFYYLYNAIKQNKKLNEFAKGLPDNYTYKNTSIKKISGHKYEVVLPSTMMPAQRYTLSNLYWLFENQDCEQYDELNDLLNDYKKSQQFKSEMQGVIND